MTRRQFSFADRRLALGLVILGAVCAMLVAAYRARVEGQAHRVEIAMDYADFSTLARSYGYDQTALLIALRRAGLTSLAVQEELGSAINSSGSAQLIAGTDVANAARLGGVAAPALAPLAREPDVANEVFLIVADPAKVLRYRVALARHFGARAVRVVRAANPTVLAIRSQIDYLNSLGFGLPEEPLALARNAALHLIPRIQNDPKYGTAQIDAIMDGFPKSSRVRTVIFFGQRSEVLGFPNNLADTAAAFTRNKYSFGSIETYDVKQLQKGNDGLARAIVGQTARVQAIAKPEQDQLDYETVIARYLLGVRERNVRVVYLRPFTRAVPGTPFTPEGANVELVRRIAAGIEARGYTPGSATPIRDFHVPALLLFAIALGVPAFLVLLCLELGVPVERWAAAAYGVTLLALAGGYLVHHDLLVRKGIALAGAILFATGAVVAVARAFTAPAPAGTGEGLRAGLRVTALATFTALGGAAVVVGLCSTALLMDEIDRFTGVKAVIVVPPLLAAAIALFSSRFASSRAQGLQALGAPVRAYQIGIALAVGAGALLYVMRSGNQSDITPSAFELALRSNLTAALGVRPRFKEFAIGFPLMMLLPSLALEVRRRYGWLLALGIAVGTADIIDTFSHLHTPLAVSLLRVFNGAVLGCALGALAVVAYVAFARRAPARLAAAERIAKRA